MRRLFIQLEVVMRFLLKSFFWAFLLAGFGWGMYFVGQNDLLTLANIKNEGMKVAKKIHAVKPPFLEKALKAVETGPGGNYKFTFFDTLNDVGLSEYVDLNGQIMKRAVYSFVDKVGNVIPDPPAIPKFSRDKKAASLNVSKAEKRKWEERAFYEPLDEVISEPSPPKLAASRPEPGKYRVQVSSFRDLKYARSLESRVRAQGYPAFVASAKIAGKGVWYRVYLGEYASFKQAQAAAHLAQNRDHLKTIILTSN